MSTEENKELHNRLTECWNQGNVAPLDEILAPDYMHHDPDRPDVRSREDYKRWVAESHSLFPDLQIIGEDQVAEIEPQAGEGELGQPGPQQQEQAEAEHGAGHRGDQ